MEPAASLIDLLDQLHDIEEPPPVPMTPATWAWAVVGLLLLALVALGLAAWWRHRRATAWRRAALAELHALAPSLEAGDPAALARLQALLHRVALVTAPRQSVASLSGAGWTRFLADTAADVGALGPDLAAAPYRPVSAYDGTTTLAAARHWIRRQRTADA